MYTQLLHCASKCVTSISPEHCVIEILHEVKTLLNILTKLHNSFTAVNLQQSDQHRAHHTHNIYTLLHGYLDKI